MRSGGKPLCQAIPHPHPGPVCPVTAGPRPLTVKSHIGVWFRLGFFFLSKRASSDTTWADSEGARTGPRSWLLLTGAQTLKRMQGHTVRLPHLWLCSENITSGNSRERLSTGREGQRAPHLLKRRVFVEALEGRRLLIGRLHDH